MRCGPGNRPRFTRKSANFNERRLHANYWKEITQLYGTYVDYFVYDYALSAHDFFYGEHPLAPYKVPPVPLVILAEFSNDSLLMSKFGIQTDADVTFIIPIETFHESFGFYSEPKAGDIIRMVELGYDRPGGMADLDRPATPPLTACEDIADPLSEVCGEGRPEIGPFDCKFDERALSAYDVPANFNRLLRGAPVFEITDVRDQNLTMQYNPLMGHYVWIISGKRFDYSYQPNAPREPGSNQVSDDTRYGLVSSIEGTTGWPPTTGLPFPEDSKAPPYDQNITDESNNEWWDYDRESGGSDDDVYGGY